MKILTKLSYFICTWFNNRENYLKIKIKISNALILYRKIKFKFSSSKGENSEVVIKKN